MLGEVSSGGGDDYDASDEEEEEGEEPLTGAAEDFADITEVSAGGGNSCIYICIYSLSQQPGLLTTISLVSWVIFQYFFEVLYFITYIVCLIGERAKRTNK